MILVYENGVVVNAGDIIPDHEGVEWIVTENVGRPPRHVSSTGRVYVEQRYTTDTWEREFFPSVFGMQWVDEE